MNLNFCCFSLSEECNLRCRMCRKWEPDISIGTSNASEPTLDDWKAAVDSLRGITKKDFMINFGGGEPLLNAELLELVRFAGQQGFRTNIATNASLIDRRMAEEIASSGLSMVNLSLDSAEEATHDRLRGKDGVYKKLMQAIEYLHKSCPALEMGVCTVISGANLGGILELAEMVQNDHRLKWVYFMALMQPNNTSINPQWHKDEEFIGLWPQDKERIDFVIDSLLALKSSGYDKIVNQSRQLKAFRSYFLAPEKFVKRSKCHFANALHISSTGDIFICYNWEKLGNIKNDELKNTLLSGKALEVRRSINGCRRNCHFLLNCFFESDFPFLF